MKKNLLLVLFLSLLLCGFSSSKPKCDDESVLNVLKEILDDDGWAYVEYGLTEQSLRALQLSLNGIDLRDLEAVASIDTSGFLRGTLKPLLDLRDFANEFVYTSFENFITQNTDDKKKTFCIAILKLTYPQMPKDMRKNYTGGALKGVIFDGGEVEHQISYSAQFTDDKKQVYVEWLE